MNQPGSRPIQVRSDGSLSETGSGRPSAPTAGAEGTAGSEPLLGRGDDGPSPTEMAQRGCFCRGSWSSSSESTTARARVVPPKVPVYSAPTPSVVGVATTITLSVGAVGGLVISGKAKTVAGAAGARGGGDAASTPVGAGS